MQCFKASDGSSNSSRRARAAEEMPISEEDIPAAMDAVKKITKKSIMLPRKSTWKLFSSGSAAHADLRSPLGETRHPSQKSRIHLCQVKISASEKDFVPGKNHNYGAIPIGGHGIMKQGVFKEYPVTSPQAPFLNSIYLDSFNLVIGWIRAFKPIFPRYISTKL